MRASRFLSYSLWVLMLACLNIANAIAAPVYNINSNKPVDQFFEISTNKFAIKPRSESVVENPSAKWLPLSQRSKTMLADTVWLRLTVENSTDASIDRHLYLGENLKRNLYRSQVVLLQLLFYENNRVHHSPTWLQLHQEKHI